MPLISREISMEVLPSSPCRVDMLMLVLLLGRPLEGAKGLLGESALLSRGRLAGGGLLHISVTRDLVLCPAQLQRRRTAAECAVESSGSMSPCWQCCTTASGILIDTLQNLGIAFFPHTALVARGATYRDTIKTGFESCKVFKYVRYVSMIKEN